MVVEIYSKDNCPYCDMAKSLLTREKISFEEINVSQNNKLKEEMIELEYYLLIILGLTDM